MLNLLEKVRKRDYEAVKQEAQAIYRADSRKAAQAAFRVFQVHWKDTYAAMVKRLERYLPELLSFVNFPRHLWAQLAHHQRH
jgi:transposase-like protein